MRVTSIVLLSAFLCSGFSRADQLTDASRQKLSASTSFASKLASAALDRTNVSVRYDPAYVRIAYPGGDVPSDTGVCTDEVIRAYRTLGIDLQRIVHEDMKRNFTRYPQHWGLSRPDTNIDHRRVPNLQIFFKRHGQSLPLTDSPADYQPGDIITSMVSGKLPHIGIVVPAPDGGGRPWIVHNIGAGPKLEDGLFSWPLTGHYRFHPSPTAKTTVGRPSSHTSPAPPSRRDRQD